jgi:hypothetical protein
MTIPWEPSTKAEFEQMIAKVPVFIREMARDKVSKRAEVLAREAGRSEIIEKDMVDAFFKETPGGFWGPLQVDMEVLGLDYTKYGYERV